MYEAELQGKDITEEDIAMLCRGLIEVCDDLPGTVIFVTNEVGMGIIPENPASRLYRDLAGRCNQIIAGRADAVTFLISGLPLNIKGDKII
jgi:adenosylcobinamide kinase/adenosylcobinamide-phosphate guanylyltransferase